MGCSALLLWMELQAKSLHLRDACQGQRRGTTLELVYSWQPEMHGCVQAQQEPAKALMHVNHSSSSNATCAHVHALPYVHKHLAHIPKSSFISPPLSPTCWTPGDLYIEFSRGKFEEMVYPSPYLRALHSLAWQPTCLLDLVTVERAEQLWWIN